MPTQPIALTPLATAASHRSAVPLAVVGLALLLAALAVRRIIRLALLAVTAGAVALVVAAWRGGLFG